MSPKYFNFSNVPSSNLPLGLQFLSLLKMIKILYIRLKMTNLFLILFYIYIYIYIYISLMKDIFVILDCKRRTYNPNDRL